MDNDHVPVGQGDFQYWAFISYSHHDLKWGKWLFRVLDTYRVPKKLVGRASPDGPVPRRLFPIFRDRDELPASGNLSAGIEKALLHSRYLIVVCSRHTPHSRWVNEEVRTFKKLGREDRVLALIVDGEPNASDGNKGVSIDQECFPEAMRYRHTSDGILSSERVEPLSPDVRPRKDGRANAKLRLLAGILGVSFDTLRQREYERWVRRLIGITTGAVTLAVAFAILGVDLFLQTNRAVQQRKVAEEQTAKVSRTFSHSQFNQAESESDPVNAVAYLASAIDQWPGNWQAGHLLMSELLNQFSWSGSLAKLEDHALPSTAAFSPDSKRILTISNDNAVRIWDARSAELVGEPLKHGMKVKSARFNADGSRIVTSSDDGIIRVWDVKNATIIFQVKHDCPHLENFLQSFAGIRGIQQRRFLNIEFMVDWRGLFIEARFYSKFASRAGWIQYSGRKF